MIHTQLNKVSIIGCGRVGMSAAFSLVHTGVVNELILCGRNTNTLVGEQLDLEHGMSFLHPCKVKATSDYRDLVNSDIVIIAAGAPQQPGESRLELTKKNVELIEHIIPHVVTHAPDAVIVLVSNPVDILTYKAYRKAGLPKGRIFGTGTTLDTARFRFHLSQFLQVNPRSIHTYVLGEHGDSSFPAVSHATIGGQPIQSMPRFTEAKAKEAYELAKTAAYRIIESKGSTHYAIGAAVSSIVTAILQDARSVLPVSVPLHNYYGHSGVALSVPCIIGRNGVEEVLEVKLSWEEKLKLHKSVNTLKGYL